MLSKTEIDQAIIAIAETKSPQAAIIRRHAGAIVEAMAAGAPMKEILSALFELTGVKIDQRWAYRILEGERKKPKAASVTKHTLSATRQCHGTRPRNRALSNHRPHAHDQCKQRLGAGAPGRHPPAGTSQKGIR